MDKYTIAEEAYKNGFEAGFKAGFDAAKEIFSYSEKDLEFFNDEDGTEDK